MTSIDIESLLTIIYVLVDDWYKAEGCRLLVHKVGSKPVFSDSEMLTLMLAHEFVPYPGETQYVGYVRANYLKLFPKLVDQSQYNRRSRGLWQVMERLRQAWVRQLGGLEDKQLLLDTKPVPVMGYARSKHHSSFAGRAAYGYCSARKLHYFGYKLVSLITLNGLPIVYDIVPANLEERTAADAVLTRVHGCDIFGDKGFLGDEWQADVFSYSANRIWTTKRANQHLQNPVAFDRLLNRVRERIETSFHQLQNTGRFLERLLAKTVLGLATRIIAKVSALTLRFLLLRDFGIDIQHFVQQPISH